MTEKHSPDPASLKKLRKAANMPSGPDPHAARRRERERREALREEQRHAFHFSDDDTLSFYDAYKMNGGVFSYPVWNVGLGLFLAGMCFATPWAFDFADNVEQFVPWNWKTFIALFVLFQAVPTTINLFQAWRSLARFRGLPFPVKGLGVLLHRTHHHRFFRPCTVRIVLKNDGSIPKETRREIEEMTAKLVVKAGNRVVSKRGISEWKREGATASGHADWKVVRNIVNVLNNHLKPLHKELNIVEAVIVETPKGKLLSFDYIEWTPEGD